MTCLIESETKIEEHVMPDDQLLRGRDLLDDFGKTYGRVNFGDFVQITFGLAPFLLGGIQLEKNILPQSFTFQK